MDNSTEISNPSSSEPSEPCVDRNGRDIPHGYYYTPGHDACQICTCLSGSPGLCRTVLCAPPSNCNSFRVKDSCCEWVCIDDVKTGEDGDPEHGGGLVAADLGLRLVACGVTAIFSIALLFFLIYRLRSRKMRDVDSTDRGNDEIGAGNDQGSIDSIAMTDLTGTNSRNYLYGWQWWKPPDDFVCQPPPPSYDAAMANDRRDGYFYEETEEDNRSGNSSGSEAPSYSQIHHDAILQMHDTSAQSLAPSSSIGHPPGGTWALHRSIASDTPYQVGHYTLPVLSTSSRNIPFNNSQSGGDCTAVESRTRRMRTRHKTTGNPTNIPVGATLVLPQPAPPLTDLHPVNIGSRSSSRNRRSHSSVTSAEVQEVTRLTQTRTALSATSLAPGSVDVTSPII